MADVFYKGIPVNKAIIVRHTPNNERNPTQKNNAGAIPISVGNLRAADDYIMREGYWELKSDIDRELTQDDLKLYEDWHNKTKLAQGLDYISRMGDFEMKGIERQFDASLWNQYGPVNRDQAEKEMLAAGGAYIDSIITVSREHAHQLGLETKQDFQRLMRATWTENCLQWRSKADKQPMFTNHNDVRWVAAYHTDASQNLHLHIHTWNAKGTIQAGDTVLPLGTRLGKEVILQEGYTNIKTERNLRGDFLRDLQIAEIKQQLGLEVTQEERERLTFKAEKNGFEERLNNKIDLTDAGKAQAKELIKDLKKELEQGEGRVANNKKAQQLGEQLVNCATEHSETVKEIDRKNNDMFMVKAGFKGYLYNEEKDLKIKDWLEKELKGYIKSEQNELLSREKSKVIRAVMPSQESKVELRKDLQHLDCAKLQNAENISFSNKLTNYAINQNLGNEHAQEIYVKTPRSSTSNPQFVKLDLKDVGDINNGQAQLAKVELNKAYSLYNAKGEFIREIQGKAVMEFYKKADMARIRKNNREMTPEVVEKEKRKVEFKKRQVERKEQVQQRMNQSINRSGLSRLNDWSIKNNMSLQDAKDYSYNLAQAAKEIKQSPTLNADTIRNNQTAQMYMRTAAEIALRGNIEENIKDVSHTIADREGWNYEEVKQVVTEVFVEKGTEEIGKMLDPETSEFELKEESLTILQDSGHQQEMTQSFNSPSFDAGFESLLGSIAECAAEGISRGKRMKFKSNMDEEQKRDYAHEQGISLKR